MLQINAVLLKPNGTLQLISIDSSILALRELLGDEVMFTKAFDTYAYAFNALAKENREAFNRIVRLPENKVIPIYGDIVIINSSTSNGLIRPIMADIMNDDVDKILNEFGLQRDELEDERVHDHRWQNEILTDTELEYDLEQNKLSFNVKAPQNSSNQRETLIAGSLLLVHDEVSLRKATSFLQEKIGLNITEFPTISLYQNLAIIYELSDFTNDEVTYKAAEAILNHLKKKFELSGVFIPSLLTQKKNTTFWQELNFHKTPITGAGLFLKLEEDDPSISELFDEFLNIKHAETKVLQKAMDDPLLPWGAKGILHYLYIVDFQTDLRQMSDLSNNKSTTVRRHLDELIDHGYIQESSDINQATWNFNSELLLQILSTIEEQNAIF
ncbi:hypothetical protein [Paenibacillus periandrae]|uniref:hypothetical protein n=1 Tax=Paenibacillus periandrae TaxID=1761741 RepID=UPI001F08B530|nr:hypothetical protein [Paenibacillus periandrae]